MTYNPKTPARALTPFGNFQLRPSHLKTAVQRVPYHDEVLIAEQIAMAAPAARITCAEHDTSDHLAECLHMLGIHPADTP